MVSIRATSVEKIIGATEAAEELMFLVKWHLCKKYEFSCGIGGSNIFFPPGDPDQNPRPDFPPPGEQVFLEAVNNINI